MTNQEQKIQELLAEIEILKDRISEDKDLIDELVPYVQSSKEYFLDSRKEILVLKTALESSDDLITKIKIKIRSLHRKLAVNSYNDSDWFEQEIKKHFEGLL